MTVFAQSSHDGQKGPLPAWPAMGRIPFLVQPDRVAGPPGAWVRSSSRAEAARPARLHPGAAVLHRLAESFTRGTVRACPERQLG